MKIESVDQDIRTLLSNGYYTIPRFQRPYSWEQENIQDIWSDIVVGDPKDYFIGSMVVYKKGSQRFGIVDGQQRLTTITILLCVLRNTLDERGLDGLANGIHSLIERRNIEDKNEFILSSESSYPFLQDHIQNRTAPEIPITPLKEERLIQAAYDQFKDLVSKTVSSIEIDTTIKDEDKPNTIQNKLKKIRDAILDLKVILIKLDDEDDAYIIFETMNARGKDLSLTDLVKNHLTRLLKAKNVSLDPAKEKWKMVISTIQGSSEELDTDVFLHHVWLSKYEYLPAKRLFPELKKRISKSEAKHFLNDLLEDASLYRSIHEISYGKWKTYETRIKEALVALKSFKVRQQTPCVLSLFRAYRNKKIRKRLLEDALVTIEKFHFLFTEVTSQHSSGGISAMYAALARRFSGAIDTQDIARIAKDLKQKLRERVPSYEQVKAAFPEIIYTKNYTKQRSLVKYILMSLAKAHTSAVVVDYDSMTIEHLVPQNKIGDGEWTDEIVGQIGNLVLVPERLNNALRDKPFKDKKKILLEKKTILDSAILKAEEWTIDCIKKRTDDIAEKAFKKIWKI